MHFKMPQHSTNGHRRVSYFGKVYSFEPVPDSLSTKEAELILGVQGNVWTEHIPTPEHYEYMIYPRILALAEIGWSPSEVKSGTISTPEPFKR